MISSNDTPDAARQHNNRFATFTARWHYSLVLLVAYPGVFHTWIYASSRTAVAIIGVSACAALVLYMLLVPHYFANGMDRLAHGMVILDLLLEALLPVIHDHYGFYLCALAFAVIVGWHRAWVLSRVAASDTPQE